MSAVRTNEVAGTRAVLRHSRTSAFKVRPVLDLIRGQDVQRAREVLQLGERDAAQLVAKVLASAVANAVNNDGETADELYVSACYADEGPTLKRWRPRARGRATRIRKRTCHVTVIVSPMSPEQLAVVRGRQAARAVARPSRTTRTAAEARRRRVARSRPGGDVTAPPAAPEGAGDGPTAPEAVEAEPVDAAPEASPEGPGAASAPATTAAPADDDEADRTADTDDDAGDGGATGPRAGAGEPDEEERA